jgi:NAD(P)-dependent dehydrogenase (short-subunit alcohol dehydrogenase family)
MRAHGGRVAIVTGAARGIGQALCRNFAQTGAKVVGLDVADLSETGAAVSEAGAEWLGLCVDVTSREATLGAVRDIAGRFGSCDILVNNAGIFPARPFDELDFEEWRRVLAINLDSQFLVSSAVVPHMKRAGWGRIVNLTSGSVQVAVPNYSAYKASKMGTIGLTRGMAADLGRYGITVNAVSPSLTVTPGAVEHGNANMQDLAVQLQAIKRPAAPGDIAGLVGFLASDAGEFVTGQTMLADGGGAYF